MIHHDIHGLRRQIVTHTKLVECTAYTNSAVLTHVLLSLAKGGVYVFDKTTFHTTKEIITIEQNGVTMIYQYSAHTCSDIVRELSQILGILPSSNLVFSDPNVDSADVHKAVDEDASLGGDLSLVRGGVESKVTKTLFKESLVRDYVAEHISKKTLSLTDGRQLLHGIISAQILKILSQKDFTFADGKIVDIKYPCVPPFTELPLMTRSPEVQTPSAAHAEASNLLPCQRLSKAALPRTRMDALWHS
jgi:hypothetical protein